MIEKHKDLILVALVGLVAFILTYTPEQNQSKVLKFIRFLSGALTAVFLNWTLYEVMFYLTSNIRVSLAISGYLTYRGTNYVNGYVDKIIVDKFIKKDIEL